MEPPQVCGQAETSDVASDGHVLGKDRDDILQRDLRKVREDELSELLDEVSVLTGPRQQQDARAREQMRLTQRRSRRQGDKLEETVRDDIDREGILGGIGGFAESSWSFVGDPW